MCKRAGLSLQGLQCSLSFRRFHPLRDAFIYASTKPFRGPSHLMTTFSERNLVIPTPPKLGSYDSPNFWGWGCQAPLIHRDQHQLFVMAAGACTHLVASQHNDSAAHKADAQNLLIFLFYLDTERPEKPVHRRKPKFP